MTADQFNTVIHMLNHIYIQGAKMSAEVDALVAQVAANVAVEAKAVAALQADAAKIISLVQQLANAPLSPADATALTKAASDLNASAAALTPVAVAS